MAITTDLTDPIGEVRLRLGDTIENKGPRPQARNFTDVEVQYFLDEWSLSVQHAVAALLYVLANEWTAVADLTIGPRKESFSKVSSGFAKRADKAANDLGVSGTTFSVGMLRNDQYAQNARGT